MSDELTFDQVGAIDRLLRFLAVEGITGQERAIGEAVAMELTAVGVPRACIRFDKVHEKIPLPTQAGNLIVTLPGTRPGPRRLFMTHLDTVPLCAGAVPVRKGNRIVAAGKTALGGDNRTGVGCLVTMAGTLMERRIPHGPLTLLFTVREESGLWGARFVDVKALGEPEMGFNIDGRSARELTIGAVGAERWEVEILGKAAHAGVHPELGISATVVASRALAAIHRQGWFGNIRKGGNKGTSNVGSFGGAGGTSAGEATNVVTDYALIKGEARSNNMAFVRSIVAAYKAAFVKAAKEVTNDKGRSAKVRFKSRRDYYPFFIKLETPVAETALAAATRAGWEPMPRITKGGLDANWTVRHGIPTITFGAGQNNIHTVEEYVELADYLESCRYALALATMAA